MGDLGGREELMRHRKMGRWGGMGEEANGWMGN